MNRNSKISRVIQEATNKQQLLEYNTPQKQDLLLIINKIILNKDKSSNPDELKKKLDDLLNFYRFYQNKFPIEDKLVYEEFKKKLQILAKKYNISL